MTSKIEQAQKISSNIKRLREALGWNQAKLAQEADITAAALSKIEKSEEARVPTIVVLRKLATALKVDVSEITGEQQIDRTVSEERDRAFFRRFGVINELSDEDQKRLLDMAERLKEITNK